MLSIITVSEWTDNSQGLAYWMAFETEVVY